MPKWNPRAKKTTKTSKEVGLSYGFRSGLEDHVATQLEKVGMGFTYEQVKFEYEKPASKHKYTPDFVLDNGIIIETKGRFMADDRKKHLLIKSQRPELDIRFIFTRSKSTINKGSRTTYADWCVSHGFRYADKEVPIDWIKERKR